MAARSPRGAPVVGFVGRLVPRKGAMELVKAAPAIRAARPEVRVVIVGDDPYEDEDTAYATAVRASSKVDHVGRVASAAGILGQLDVLVLPSTQEPFGTVVAEAMAAGTPVVATRVDGLPELVEDGVSGKLVEPGDTAALAVAVLEVLERRDEMGAAARRGGGALRRRRVRRAAGGPAAAGRAGQRARRRSAGAGCTTARRPSAAQRPRSSSRATIAPAWRSGVASRQVWARMNAPSRAATNFDGDLARLGRSFEAGRA